MTAKRPATMFLAEPLLDSLAIAAVPLAIAILVIFAVVGSR